VHAVLRYWPLYGCAVECTPLKRSLEATYAAILPKAAKPFFFLVRAEAAC
jgi:hypothetical protein